MAWSDSSWAAKALPVDRAIEGGVLTSIHRIKKHQSHQETSINHTHHTHYINHIHHIHHNQSHQSRQITSITSINHTITPTTPTNHTQPTTPKTYQHNNTATPATNTPLTKTNPSRCKRFFFRRGFRKIPAGQFKFPNRVVVTPHRVP